MLEEKQIVINTGPLIALVAALGDLGILSSQYQRVLVPFEVCQEIRRGGANGFAVTEFEAAEFLRKLPTPTEISPFLRNVLDSGESAVIQLALDEHIDTVCIDETAGRRIARLNELKLTGSVGILVRAKRDGGEISLRDAVARMQAHGIHLSQQVIRFALSHD